jgi:hypothetical protein
MIKYNKKFKIQIKFNNNKILNNLLNKIRTAKMINKKSNFNLTIK